MEKIAAKLKMFCNLSKSAYNYGHVFCGCDLKMCEFNVIINGKVQFRDVIYSKVDGETITVKNIMGEAKEFKGFRIVEIDVPNTRLVLVPLNQSPS